MMCLNEAVDSDLRGRWGDLEMTHIDVHDQGIEGVLKMSFRELSAAYLEEEWI